MKIALSTVPVAKIFLFVGCHAAAQVFVGKERERKKRNELKKKMKNKRKVKPGGCVVV